jgi:hypothetical protein
MVEVNDERYFKNRDKNFMKYYYYKASESDEPKTDIPHYLSLQIMLISFRH